MDTPQALSTSRPQDTLGALECTCDGVGGGGGGGGGGGVECTCDGHTVRSLHFPADRHIWPQGRHNYNADLPSLN